MLYGQDQTKPKTKLTPYKNKTKVILHKSPSGITQSIERNKDSRWSKKQLDRRMR